MRMSTTPPSRPPRRLKLLVWAQNRGRERAKAAGESAVQCPRATPAAVPAAEIDAQVEAVMESLRGLGHECRLLAQQCAGAERTLDASRAALARQAASLRDVALGSSRNRPSAVVLLREALAMVEQQGGACAAVALTIHAGLARLFASFRWASGGGLTHLELAAYHLSAASALEEDLSVLSGLPSEDAIQAHHSLGLAAHACGREHSDASYRAMYFQRSEQHLRECLSLGSSISTSMQTSNADRTTTMRQADIHGHLAALYVDMSASSSSCLAAGHHHFFEAADKFGAAGLPARCCHTRVHTHNKHAHTQCNARMQAPTDVLGLGGMRGSGCRENNIMLTAGRLLLRSQDWPGALQAFQRGLAAGRRVQATVRRQCRRRQWRAELGTRVYAGARASGSGASQCGSGAGMHSQKCPLKCLYSVTVPGH